jgi:glycosyltransferase involved in cell wall biosynthesis
MSKSSGKVVVVLPAYHAERTLERVYVDIDRKIVDQVILVDDGSKDDTALLSRKLGIKTIVHPKNKGYGGNQNTCYKNALKAGADFTIMLHPDGQYDPKDLKKFVKVYRSCKADVVLGSRFLKSGDTETPGYKSLSIRIITFFFNLVLGTKLTEANTGYRGYTREVLEKVPFSKNGDGYIFDPQMLIQSVAYGFKVAEVPVHKKYNPERIEPNFKKSLHHGLENMYLLYLYILNKLGLKKVDFLTN